MLDELCAALPSLPASDEADGLRCGEGCPLQPYARPWNDADDVVSSVVEEESV